MARQPRLYRTITDLGYQISSGYYRGGDPVLVGAESVTRYRLVLIEIRRLCKGSWPADHRELWVGPPPRWRRVRLGSSVRRFARATSYDCHQDQTAAPSPPASDQAPPTCLAD